MDDNGNIIYYILLGVIYLLSRVFGKKKKKPAAPARKPQSRQAQREAERAPIEAPTADKEPEMSFEDILRELSGVPQPKPKADPTPRRQPTPAMDALEPDSGYQPAPAIEGKPQPAYTVDDMDQIATTFEVPKPIGSERLPEPDLAALRRKDLSFKRDDKYRIKKKQTIDYLKMLREPGGPAKAFVMGEIFNRKF